MQQRRARFRPLSGILYSKQYNNNVNNKQKFPSPIGDLIFQTRKFELFGNKKNLFPSPIGDPIFQTMRKEFLDFINEEFPSPIGDLIFQTLPHATPVKSTLCQGFAWEKESFQIKRKF